MMVCWLHLCIIKRPGTRPSYEGRNGCAAEWTESSYVNVVPLAILHKTFLRPVRVTLDLIDGWFDLGRRQ
jgi:hypothetical protein